MGKRILMLVEVHDETIDNEGLKYATQEAYGKDVTVHEVSDYPFDNNHITPHFLDVYNDAKNCLTDEHNLTEEQLCNISFIVGDQESNTPEERYRRILDTAEKLGYIKEEE